jgi:hypothetical protein
LQLDKVAKLSSAIFFLPSARVSTERDNHESDTPNRSVCETAALALIPLGVRPSIVRLAPTVHGDGDHGFISQIIAAARKKGVSPYIGDGANRWPSVHRRDAAKLFRLALEKGEAGAKYHGVAEVGIPFREIACSISAHLQVPAVSIPSTKAAKHFGILSNFIGLNNAVSRDWTREALGWSPEQTGLLADMNAHYFWRRLPQSPIASQRPAEADDRAIPGHCGGDLILGLGSSAIGTLVERTTRFTMLLHLPRLDGHGAAPRAKNGPALAGHGAEAVRDAITRTIVILPQELRRSLTWDQGAEMA